jgi:tetratricopeptide (TPR) repeat protein
MELGSYSFGRTIMEGGTKVRKIEPYGIEVKEYSLGAYTGEFPTILVAILSGIVGGILSEIGVDIWKALKGYLQKRFRELERDRKIKEKTSQGRYRVITAYIITESDRVPLIYCASPIYDELTLDFDFEELVRAESEIRLLIKAKKINKSEFLGINLNKLGNGPYLSTFKAIPNERSIVDEITADKEKVEAYTHSLVGIYFDDIDMPSIARRHYELALQGVPEDASLRINLGITYAREDNLDAARKYWEEAAKIDGKFDVLHYNIACYFASHGNVALAAQELQLAVQYGFREIGILIRDPEFAAIIHDPKIQAIVKEIKEFLH